jgi:hypothetical protein
MVGVSLLRRRLRRASLQALSRLALALIPIAGASAQGDGHSGAETMGWVEYATLFPGGVRLRAKLDTGAKTSSIDVSKLETFSRNGRKWTRFAVSDRNGATAEFERPIVRYSRIRRSQAKTVRRPVVTLGLCLGSRYQEVEVNLAERSHLNYPLLLGRASLDGFVVDPSRKFTAEPRCRRQR